MKTLLIVIVLLLGGKVELYHHQFDTPQECAAEVPEAMVKFKDRPGYGGAVALCTPDLQETPKKVMVHV